MQARCPHLLLFMFSVAKMGIIFGMASVRNIFFYKERRMPLQTPLSEQQISKQIETNQTPVPPEEELNPNMALISSLSVSGIRFLAM